ncbi:MAG: DUF3857 domain-containing protein [Planctomycetes bacterium]|nr:DUF3857 domain-containing protein [Planctomycetota bacterium]
MSKASRPHLLRLTVLLGVGLCGRRSAAADVQPSPIEQEFEQSCKSLRESQSHPRSVVEAYRCFQMESELPSPRRLDALFREILDSPSACPVLRSHADWFLALREFNRGERGRAEARLQRIGVVRDWWVIGPFDNEGKSGFDQGYPPEESVDLSASYRGRERMVSWRVYPSINPYGEQDLAAIFRPNLHVCAYAVAGVQSDRKQDVAIRVGSDDAVKVWLNGYPVLSNASYRPLRFDQDAGHGSLARGLNAVLVKVCQKDGEWGFRLRLTTPEGGGVSGIQVMPAGRLKGQKLSWPRREAPDTPPSSGGGAEAGKDSEAGVVSPLVDLRDRALEEHAAAEAYLDLGDYLAAVQAEDVGRNAPRAAYEKALEREPSRVRTLLLLAAGTEDHNERRAWLRRALELDPGSVRALMSLSYEHRDRGDWPRQIDLLRRVQALCPDYFPAEVALARAMSQRPIEGLAWETVQKVKRKCPEAAWVDFVMGEIAGELGLVEESSAAYERFLACRWTDNVPRRRLLETALKKRDLRRCLKLYDEMIEAQPQDLSVRKEKARLLASNGKLREAAEELEAALAICPEDAESLQALGDVHQRAGKMSQALAVWRQSLELHPQNPELREYLEFLASEEDAFEIPYLADAAGLAAEPLDASRYPEDSAVQLADIVVQKLHPNGTSSRYTQQVIRILTEKGAERARYHRVYYSADHEGATIEGYRVIKPDGRELKAGEVDEDRVTQGEMNTFYDYRVKTLRLPRLEAGDVIEWRHRVSDVADRTYFGEHFGELELFRSSLPTRLKKYVLIAPRDRKLYFHQERMGPPEIETGEWTRYQWSERDVPGLPEEPLSPAPTSVLPYVHVSSFQDWGQVAEYYANMVRDQFQVDGAMRDVAGEITRGKETDLEKTQALYHYLSRKTRYVALEFGIHGYLPYPAPQVFARRYGDCKDKAVLLATLLRTVGIDAQIALVRTRYQGGLHPEPASLAAFDHCICYVPKLQLWLDCTTEFNGTTELPDMDRGALALRIGSEGDGEIRRPPAATPADNRIGIDVQAVLGPGGQLSGKGVEVATGSHCPRLRELYQKSGGHQEIFEGILRRHQPGARVTKVGLSNLKDMESPVRLEFEFRIPDFARARGREMQFQPGLFRQDMVQRYAPQSKRALPLEVFSPWLMEQRVRITLPEGIQWMHVPAEVDWSGKFGSYRYRVLAQDGALAVEEQLVLQALQVAPAEYTEFRDFCQKVDEKRNESVRFQLP